jgi:peptide/nickel transport system permease protein
MTNATTLNPPTDSVETAAAEQTQDIAPGPIRDAWRGFRKHRLGLVGMALLILLLGMALFADLIAPYNLDSQIRDLQWAPPTRLHFSDAQGFSWRPFIYPTRSFIDENFNVRQEEERSQRCYFRFFPQVEPRSFLGLFDFRTRLFGFDPPKPSNSNETYYARFYLLGADLVGRDIFSRICYGARISMTIGLLGEMLVLIIGLLVGGISGYVGGLTDDLLQRICEIIMLLPGFYLLLMLRFMFPPDMSSTTVYFAVVTILALVSWPGLARVIRGMVLSIRQMDYVNAARALGVRPMRIIMRHVLPNTFSYVIVTATLSIPGYILGESALSLLGLGIMEPTPSWGNMLQKALDIAELDQHPWVLWPGLFIFLAVIAFNLVGDALRDALDPKRARH